MTQKIWDKSKLHPQTGTILLSKDKCGAGVVTHEIMHAVLWGRDLTKSKRQYPIRIKNMEDEEKVLTDFTLAVMQFYRWFWRTYKQA